MKNVWKDRFDALFESRTRRALALALAIIVTFTTTYSLVLPAITLEKDTAETMPGVSLGGNEQDRGASTSSAEEDSRDSNDGDTDTVSFDAEAKNDDGETEALVHVEADAGAFPEGTTLEAAVVTDQDVLDSIAEATEDEVVAVHAVDLTFSDESGEPVQPAEGSQVSVTLSAGSADSSEVKDTEDSGNNAPAGQTTETTVVQYSEENGAEQIETTDDISFQVEPENDLDQDSAVSFDMGEQAGEQESQTYAIVETVPEEGGKENTFTDEAAEVDPGVGEAAPQDGETVPEEEETVPEEEALPQEELADEPEETTLTARDDSYLVTLICGPEAQIPQGASLQVEEILSENKAYDDHLEETKKALNEAAQTEALEEGGIYAGPEAEEPQFFGARSLMADPVGFDLQQADADSVPETEIVYARFFDITILDADGDAVEPAAPVKVSIELLDAEQEELVIQNADAAQVIHFGDEETELVEAKVIEDTVAGVTFDAAGFSVYGVVYTVDFHWDVNGETFDYSIPGGGVATLYELVEALGIAADDADTEQDEIQALVDGVEKIEFSDPALVCVSKADADTTVGAIKEALGLVCEYSADLTGEQIAEIDAQTVKAGDWALISLKPFDTEESLTVTMKNGDQWTVVVTDAQIRGTVITDSGDAYEVTVTYPDSANIPEGSTLRVTEFKEDTEAYAYARNAVLADKKARGEQVDLGSFNLAALDISILNPEGEEIEPAAPVHVDIRIKELPGVEDLNDVADSIEIQHHIEAGDKVVVDTVYNGGAADAKFDVATNEEAIAEGTAVDPDSYVLDEATDDLSDTDETDEIDASFETDLFSTYTISYYYNYYGKRIHYVDTNGNSLTPTMTPNFNARHQFLIYDIEGYEYDSTHVGSRTGTSIQPILRASHEYGLYYSGNIQYRNGNNWSNLKNDDIYVVYKAKTPPAQGGSPTLKPVESEDYPDDPTILKESEPNGDGTANLSLSITGHTKDREVEKLADVIVVFDVSGSMSERMSGSTKTRLAVAKEAVNNLVDNLATKKNSDGDPLVRMSLISFSTTARSEIGLTDLTEQGVRDYKEKVGGLSANGGTNWDYALQLANEQAVDSGRATFVIFVTDGDPTFRVTRGNVADSDLDMYTDGTYQYYRSNRVFGTGYSDDDSRNYNAAVAQGQAIVGANKNLYTIGISNDVTKVDNFNTAAGGKDAYIADDASALNKAFTDIASSIIATMGFSDIQMTDGITEMTQTVDKSGLTTTSGEFTYWKKAKGAESFVEWDPSSEHCREAEYDDTSGAVKWDMGPNFMLEDGATYKVTWQVWPSQEAYDILAKCKNDPAFYGTLTDAQTAQIIRTGTAPNYSYTLKTNEPGANTTYKSATKTSSGITTEGDPIVLPFNEVHPLGLASSQISIEKVWKNLLDDRTVTGSYTFPVKADNVAFGDGVELSSNQTPKWKNTYNISTGLMTTDPYVVYEKGHDYIIEEPEDLSYNWDFKSDVYHPMVINNKVVNLIKVDTAAESDYTIDGKYYKALSGEAVLTAINERRSNLNLSKTVVDQDENHIDTDQSFTFTVTVTEGHDDEVWLSAYDTKTEATVMDPGIVTGTGVQYQESDGYFHAPSGTTLTLTLKDGWNYRFTNLSLGSTYSIEENSPLPDGFTFVKAETDATNEAAPGTVTDQKVEGTINKSNSIYTAAYTNKANITVLKFRKTNEDGTTPLAGADIEIIRDRAAIEGSPFTTTTEDLELTLVDGIYQVKETNAPSGYLILNGEVYFKTADGVVTITDQAGNETTYDDFTMDTEAGVIVLKLKNHPGAALPNTGGPGTATFTILGTVLIAGAGLLLCKKRQVL